MKENLEEINIATKRAISQRLKYVDKVLGQRKCPNNLEVADCTTIAGKGLRAAKQIPKGSIIGVYAGKIVRDIDYLGKELYFFGLCENYSIDGLKEGNYTRFINHSYTHSNTSVFLAFLDDSDAPQVIITSEKTINAGEWLLLNYGDEYFNALELDPIELKPTDP